MLELFKYELRPKYPHMKPYDVAIWERFILKYPDLYKEVQYDYHVGDPPEFSKELGDVTEDNQHMLYQLKIDVLGHNPGKIDIIEVKPNAAPASIGQVQSYRTLFVRDEKPAGTIGTVIVTDNERLNMRYLCQQAGVTLYVV